MTRLPLQAVAEDVRAALRLVALAFDREAARILADHEGDPIADFASQTVAAMSAGEARKAFLDLQ